MKQIDTSKKSEVAQRDIYVQQVKPASNTNPSLDRFKRQIFSSTVSRLLYEHNRVNHLSQAVLEDIGTPEARKMNAWLQKYEHGAHFCWAKES